MRPDTRILRLALPVLLSGCALDLSHAREDADACIARGLTPGSHAFAACRTGLEKDRRDRAPGPTGEEAVRLLFDNRPE